MLKSTSLKEKYIDVHLGERSYPIYIGAQTLGSLPTKLVDRGLTEKSIIVTNPEVLKHYKETLIKAFNKEGLQYSFLEIASGEESKTAKKALGIVDQLIALEVDRMTPLIAFGGGVIGDLAGFVSAIYMRGLPYIQVPTTLLAQLDSSVGGKVAVNRRDTKNIVGSFYQPRFVLADVATLSTLSGRDYACGLAETIKYALIADDHFLDYVEENIDKLNKRDSEVLTEVVTKCCSIKAQIVEQDERDLNIRAVLNIGHTVGHAIEGTSHFHEYRHGEAVSVGLVAASYISLELGYIKEDFVKRLKKLLKKAGLPISVSHLSVDDVTNRIKLDKKVVAGKPRFVLLKKPGETIVETVSPAIVKNAVERIISG